MVSAGSTSSAALSFSRESIMKSLADELDSAFEDLNIDTVDNFELEESLKANYEDAKDDVRKAQNIGREGHEKLSAVGGEPKSPAVANDDPNSSHTLGNNKEQHSTETPAAPSIVPKKSMFIEHLSQSNTSFRPTSQKDHTKLMTSKHNRELIERNTNGFFKMETMPYITDVQRHAQQAEGIAALQRTLVPATVPAAGSSSTSAPHAPLSRAVDPANRPLALRKIVFAEPRDRKRQGNQDAYPSAGGRSKATPRFSLARDLIASGYKKRMLEPSAPARFVRIPTDPMLDFKRSLVKSGLKIVIPKPDLKERERDNAGSITSGPDVDTAGDLKLRNDKPKFEFGTPRRFIADQCLESSCPLRWAHAKGPYHHNGHRHNNIMTGLFGHSNPPPEIWNAYRNMIQITRDGEIISPSERPRPKVDDDLVIAFAIFHYGELNTMSGEEFHKRYAGRHMASKISLQSTSTNSSTNSGDSLVASRN